MRADWEKQKSLNAAHAIADTEKKKESTVKTTTAAKLKTGKRNYASAGLICEREKLSRERTELFEIEKWIRWEQNK